MDRLKRKFGASVKTSTPKVPYRETIRKATRIDNRFKRQTGGHGQFGHVVIEFEPLDSDADFEFGDRIVGGVVPKQYIPAVEKGLREAMSDGVLAGYPVVGMRATLVDGSYHTVDSSEMAFKVAASQALKRAFPEANPVLLEPVLEVEVTVPDEYMGDAMGQITVQARPRAGHGLERRDAAPARAGPAGGDVPLRDRAALDHPGTRPLHLEAGPLRGGAAQHRREGDRRARGVKRTTGEGAADEAAQAAAHLALPERSALGPRDRSATASFRLPRRSSSHRPCSRSAAAGPRAGRVMRRLLR